MEIRNAEYRVWFEPQTATVYLEGSLRLSTKEYDPINDLLNQVLEQGHKKISLHTKALSFLNSSGINALYKFAISARKKGDVSLVVKGSEAINWQVKSLPNLRKFLPSTELQMK